ncbi:MAG: peptide-methionine (S)-S-oxide reductase, partial [Saprospiraceae bacterium]|nr:peptide-methionine (S)-S-oxide reductase [Saprospiraceae bacterium]
MKIMRVPFIAIVLSVFVLSADCQKPADSNPDPERAEYLKKFSKAYVAAGCFWCVEAVFESVEGVEEAISGYAGDSEENANYKKVSMGLTRHA